MPRHTKHKCLVPALSIEAVLSESARDHIKALEESEADVSARAAEQERTAARAAEELAGLYDWTLNDLASQ